VINSVGVESAYVSPGPSRNSGNRQGNGGGSREKATNGNKAPTEDKSGAEREPLGKPEKEWYFPNLPRAFHLCSPESAKRKFRKTQFAKAPPTASSYFCSKQKNY
jgi:hypothetical protein